MAHLGDFGTAPETEETTFTYFGVEIHANPNLGELDYIDFLEKAAGVSVNDAVGATLVKDFARICIAAGDFDEFWRLAKANRQNSEDVTVVLYAVVEAATGRPTGQSSDSANGPEDTGTTSGGVVSSALMESLDGRPDLQVVVQKAAEAKAG